MGSPVLTGSSFLRSLSHSWGGRQVKYKAGVLLDLTQPKERSGRMQAMVCVCMWMYGCLKAIGCRVCCPFLMCKTFTFSLSLSVYGCVDTWTVTEGDPSVSGLLCPVHLRGQTPLAVSFTAWLCQLDSVKSDGVFLPLKPSWAERQGEQYNRLSDRFSKQAGHEYASSSTNSQEKKKLLDVAESENKQFCHTQAAALTLSAYFSESLTVSSILSPQQELEDRVSLRFHH